MNDSFSAPSTRCGVALAVLISLPLHAADWPQYRGPRLDGSSADSIARSWPVGGPKALWRVPTADGFSSITVSGGRAFTLVKREVDGAQREVCVALEASNGKELWSAPLAVAKYDGGGDSGTADNKGGDGPRSTPSVDGNRVYVLDARLTLACFEAATGRVVWTRDLAKDHGAKNITWQNAASPLIEGELVFVAGGGAGEALLGIDKRDGRTVWKGQDDRMTHATPIAATIHGERQVVFFTQTGLVSVRPVSGEVLWRHAFPYRTSTAASPVVAGEIVYCSAGYGVGAAAARISKDGGKFVATELWRKPGQLMNHWSTPVYRDGHLYGLFGFKEYGSCPLKCVELVTGKEVWSKEGFGPGNLVLAGDRLVVLGDAGQLVVAEASPKGYSELGRADLLEGKCWSTPALSDGRVFIRSTKEAVCVDLAAKSALLNRMPPASR